MARKAGTMILALLIVIGLSLTQAEEPAPKQAPTGQRTDRKIAFAIGGGIAESFFNPEGPSGDVDGHGLFFNAQMIHDDGTFVQFTASRTSETPALIDHQLGRLGVSVGFMFRKNSTVRPLIHAGVALIRLEQELDGLEVANDSSSTPFLGVGLMAGSGYQNFYVDVVLDDNHDVEDSLGSRADVLLTEVHLGYLHKF